MQRSLSRKVRSGFWWLRLPSGSTYSSPSLLSASSRRLSPADTSGTPSVLPREPDVPWEERGHPREVSGPLLKPSALPAATLGSAQSQGQTGPLGFQCCPRTAPELCQQLWASWSQQTQSSGWCTGDPGHCAKCLRGRVPRGEPLPGLAPRCCPGLMGNRQSHLVSFTSCATPRTSRWVGTENAPGASGLDALSWAARARQTVPNTEDLAVTSWYRHPGWPVTPNSKTANKKGDAGQAPRLMPSS